MPSDRPQFSERHEGAPYVALATLALVVGYILRDVLVPGNARLPGLDSSNLYAWDLYTRDVLASGQLPHWNPYHFAGTPHLADPQTQVFYPPAMLLRALPPVAFLSWMMALHLWVAGAGTVFLSRVANLGWMASLSAAFAVMLGGSTAAWIYNGHLLVISTVAWFPLALGLAIVSLRRRRLLPHPALVAVMALQFLAGYLQGSLYITGAVVLYFVFTALWPDGVRDLKTRLIPVGQLTLLGAMAIGLAAFQLVPAVRLISEAGRTTGVPYEVAVESSWQAQDLVTFFFPFYRAEAAPPQRYLADRLAYVGWLLACAIPFAFADAKRRRFVLFFALLAGISLAFAFGDSLQLFRVQYALFPGLRIPGRMLFVATVACALLGAIGLERLVSLASERRWKAVGVTAAFTATAVLIATVVALPRLESEIAAMHAWPWPPLLAVGGLVLITVLGATGAIRTALAAALIVVVIDVGALSARTVETVPVTSSEELRRWMGPPVEGRGLTLCENQIGAGEFLVNHQPTVDGMAAIHLGPYGEWAYLAKFGQSPPGDGMFRRIGSEGAIPLRRDLIDLAHVTAIVSCRALDEHGLTAVKANSPYVYRNAQAWPRAVWSCRAEPVSRDMAIARLLRSRFDSQGRLWPRHYMNVRWAPHVTEDQRRTLERSHHLSEGVVQQGSTWRYSLDDQTVENVMAIMLDPAVEDTHGVDRKTGEPIRNPEPGTRNASEEDTDGAEELLVHTGGCAASGEAAVVAADRPDGSVAVDVKAESDGFLFLSEPFYSERRAFVDGESVTPRRANIAFTAIPVPAGGHRVELRLVPRSFHVGLGITALTLTGWLGAIGLMRK